MKMHVIIESRSRALWLLPGISARRWGLGILTLGEEVKCDGLRASAQAHTVGNDVSWVSKKVPQQKNPTSVCPSLTKPATCVSDYLVADNKRGSRFFAIQAETCFFFFGQTGRHPKRQNRDRSCGEKGVRLALAVSQRALAIFSSSEPAQGTPKCEHRTILHSFIHVWQQQARHIRV